MNDAELTQALRHIGVDRRTVRALPLLPLVQVAWADGRVQSAERGLILEVAERYGLQGLELKLLDRWLSKRPEEADFLLARQVLLVLWSRDRERGSAPDSLDGVIRMCMCVARVAGGLFGVAFTMDRRETELIGEISQSLQLGPSLTKAAKAALAVPPRSIADDETTILPRRPARQRKGSPSRRLAEPVDPSEEDNGRPKVQHKEVTPVVPKRRAAAKAPSPPPTKRKAPKKRPPKKKKAYDRGPAGETLLPPDDEDDSSTMPLASLKRMLEDEDETEVDIPMLPHDYDFDFD